MNKKIFFPALLLMSLAVSSQNITGSWSGELEFPNMKMPLIFHITNDNDTLKSTMDSPMQGAKGVHVDKTEFKNNVLTFEIKRVGFAYEGKLIADSIVGNIKQNNIALPFTLKRAAANGFKLNRPQTPKPPFNYEIEEVSFSNPAEGNTLAGTLTTPYNKKQFPVVVLITGSGPQDRDETLFGHKPFWVIADHLTKNGIGVLRLDDRGVGGSSKGKENPTSADFATDIDAAVNFLLKKDYKNIGLIGHSEGGEIAPVVADKNKAVKFIILMSGPGVPGDELMVLQNMALLKSSGANAEMIKSQKRLTRGIYALIKKYEGPQLKDSLTNYIMSGDKDLPPEMQIPQAQKNDIIANQMQILTSPWYRHLLLFNPDVYLRKLKIPVLAIAGSKDIQVTPRENLAGIKRSLEKAGNKNFKIVELEGLNHLFQEAKTGSPAEYAQIEQTISPKVLDLMTDWILKLK